MIEKKTLRRRAKEIRHSLDIEKISEGIVSNILNLCEYKKAKNIMIFYPLKSEINLLKLMENSDKNFFLPKVDGREMLICPYKIGNELMTSDFKTKEPITCEISDYGIIDIIFLPALMADKNKNRLGYGGGFYDRFLSKHCKKAVKIVAIAQALTTEKIPHEAFDEKVDYVITEKGVF